VLSSDRQAGGTKQKSLAGGEAHYSTGKLYRRDTQIGNRYLAPPSAEKGPPCKRPVEKAGRRGKKAKSKSSKFVRGDPPAVVGLPIAQLLSPGCSISLTLHVVNFAHLDGLVVCLYHWLSPDEFPELIEGADQNAE
jgi:hypothetical protein